MFNINKISHKLILISLLIVVGMVSMLVLQRSNASSIEAIGHADIRVGKIKSDMLTLRRHEKDFLMRLDVKYQARFNDHVKVIISEIDSLKSELSSLGDSNTQIDELKRVLVDYGQRFNDLVQLQEAQGLDPNSGLYGTLREAVHKAESKINELNNFELLAKMLMLRRHEKDFMLRDQLKYLDRFNKSHSSFISSLNASNIERSVKLEINSSMQNYKASFAEFVRGKETLGLSSSEGALGELRKTVHQSEDLLKQLAKNVLVTSQEHRTFASILSITIALLIAAIIISIVVLLSVSISKPIRYLSDLMVNISRNKDLTIRYNYEGPKELNDVGSSLNDMLHSFEQSIQEVSQSTISLSSAADQLNTITQSSSEGIRLQQAETASVSTAIEEMTTTVLEVSHAANNAAESAKIVDQESKNGAQLVRDTTRLIGELSKQVIDTAVEMDQLKDEAESINTVVQVIGSIAEQTNLLALNAAIEAARAGETGRGFAVVADEVRTLASRSQASTQEISAIIERLQAKTQSAVSIMKSGETLAQSCVEQATIAGEAIEKITSAVSTISAQNSQIASAADEQTSVAEEIKRNLVNINNIANNSNASATETSQTSSALAKLAVEMQTGIRRFILSR